MLALWSFLIFLTPNPKWFMVVDFWEPQPTTNKNFNTENRKNDTNTITLIYLKVLLVLWFLVPVDLIVQKMRLLTHNTMKNNTEAAKGKGWPLRISAVEVRVDDASEIGSDPDREIAFVKGILGMLDWPTLVQGAAQLGLNTLPPTLSEEMAQDPEFLRALFHVLMNVHLVKGMLTCPDTGREFPVTDSIVDFSMEEEECENVRNYH
jgi:multifunctional methyltransferase subunit TRM112